MISGEKEWVAPQVSGSNPDDITRDLKSVRVRLAALINS